MIRVAMIIPDNREEHHLYDAPEPAFGPAPLALLRGFSRLNGVRVDVVSCTKRPLRAPVEVMPNVTYHSVLVHQGGWLRTLYAGCVHGIRKKLRELNPDIVHGMALGGIALLPS